ncbi:MAG: hypothetical protein QXQ33_00625 [Nitrososphaerota archaeon]
MGMELSILNLGLLKCSVCGSPYIRLIGVNKDKSIIVCRVCGSRGLIPKEVRDMTPRFSDRPCYVRGEKWCHYCNIVYPPSIPIERCSICGRSLRRKSR